MIDQATENDAKGSSGRQTAISVLLFALILITLGALHVYTVFFFTIRAESLFAALVAIAVMSWLFAGLFIVAHDAMHGSFAPGRPWLNESVGALILALYAGFDWRRMKKDHMCHHKYPGTADDPDFYAIDARRFWPWYFAFMKRYFGLPQLIFVSSVVAAYYFYFGAAYVNIVLFYGVPAILSSAQLFYFGTYLPHRLDEAPFVDEHNARSNEFSYLLSLLTCFHFGYHREHHVVPGAPWWRLPAARKKMKQRSL